MKRLVLDSNATDPLIDLPGALQYLQRAAAAAGIEILYTHVTVDENGDTPDPVRRARLLAALAGVGRKVPTGGAVFDSSKWDEARWFDGTTVENIHQGSPDDINDALIATTAVVEDAVLVTRDVKLTGRAERQGIRVITMPALLAELGFGACGEATPARPAPRGC